MRRFLTYAFSLVLVAVGALLAFDSLCVALVKQSQGTSMYKMYRLFGHHPSDEIPIFGSSRAASNFVPSLINPKAFCYGVDGSGMGETLFLVENYLKMNPEGGPIIVNFDPWGFPRSHNDEFVADYTLASIPQPSTLNSQPSSILGIRMIGKLRGILASWLNQRLAGTKRIDNGAILQLVSRTEEEWKFINAKTEDWGFFIDQEWRDRVANLSSLSHRRIIWVVGPCEPHWKRTFSGRPASLSFLSELRNQHDTAVIDLYDIGYESDLFMDAVHLNEKGASAFTGNMVKSFGELLVAK